MSDRLLRPIVQPQTKKRELCSYVISLSFAWTYAQIPHFRAKLLVTFGGIDCETCPEIDHTSRPQTIASHPPASSRRPTAAINRSARRRCPRHSAAPPRVLHYADFLIRVNKCIFSRSKVLSSSTRSHSKGAHQSWPRHLIIDTAAEIILSRTLGAARPLKADCARQSASLQSCSRQKNRELAGPTAL